MVDSIYKSLVRLSHLFNLFSDATFARLTFDLIKHSLKYILDSLSHLENLAKILFFERLDCLCIFGIFGEFLNATELSLEFLDLSFLILG